MLLGQRGLQAEGPTDPARVWPAWALQQVALGGGGGRTARRSSSLLSAASCSDSDCVASRGATLAPRALNGRRAAGFEAGGWGCRCGVPGSGWGAARGASRRAPLPWGVGVRSSGRPSPALPLLLDRSRAAPGRGGVLPGCSSRALASSCSCSPPAGASEPAVSARGTIPLAQQSARIS